jgi:hypothetical protein
VGVGRFFGGFGSFFRDAAATSAADEAPGWLVAGAVGRERKGLDQAEFPCGFEVTGGFSPMDRVRRMSGIFCKIVEAPLFF